jgi:hypothetical protein
VVDRISEHEGFGSLPGMSVAFPAEKAQRRRVNGFCARHAAVDIEVGDR